MLHGAACMLCACVRSGGQETGGLYAVGMHVCVCSRQHTVHFACIVGESITVLHGYAYQAVYVQQE